MSFEFSASKRQKKGSRKKSNGKKSAKNVVEKSKHEIENFTKEQITELEKEMFSIKISEMERKLTRKKQMCFHIEEKKNLYEALYKEKKKLAEVEQGAKDIVQLNSKLGALEDSVSIQEKNFECSSQDLIFEFNTFLKRIFEDLISAINEIIEDTSLKLEFLPSYYQALFMSGNVGTHWLNSTLEHCKMYFLQNQEINRHLTMNSIKRKIEEDFRKNLLDISTSLQVEEFMGNWDKMLIVSDGQPAELLETELFQNVQEQFKHIESKKKLALSENKIEILMKKIENLEKIVKRLECCGEKNGENSQLALKVNVAVDIIKREI
ncbi:uncharacterized protein LOC129231612 isoform X3 [Uloborus diversus]|uniref:uncharacterized protein LOC129231612 isoform X3 n=1 Tax=Uloborus diversus TaxID=327109 RepID=UPI002409E693|nr:uncharacterized protein LOC129231612 isoform X3 [Uloborus diversus]